MSGLETWVGKVGLGWWELRLGLLERGVFDGWVRD